MSSYGATGDVRIPQESERDRRLRLREEERMLRKIEAQYINYLIFCYYIFILFYIYFFSDKTNKINRHYLFFKKPIFFIFYFVHDYSLF